MSRKSVLEHFQKVDLPDPVEIVIQQIRDLIHNGTLKPGDRLPSEKNIESKMGVPRVAINKALRRLETYGILKTVPQSGTYVARLGVDALEGLLSNVLKLEIRDYEAVDETRNVLELHAVRLVAERSTEEEFDELARLQKEIAEKVASGEGSYDEDMVFHLKLAEFCRNPIMKSILTLLVSDVLQIAKELETRIGPEKVKQRLVSASEEHAEIVAALRSRDAEKAVDAMQRHFDTARRFREQALSATAS